MKESSQCNKITSPIEKEILQELPLEKWPILQKKLKQLWPINIPGYYALHHNIKYPKVREAFQFKVYNPYGEMDNGFVGITIIKEIQCVILFSLTEDISNLIDAIIKTKLIDWSKCVLFDMMTSMCFKNIARLNEELRFTRYDVGAEIMFLLKGTTKPFDLRLPENTYAAAVKQSDIIRVNDVWSYKYNGSDFYFTTLASNGLSYGLYSYNHELLAWVFLGEYNFLCHLYCEEIHRRKGYAEYVMKWAVNEQLKDGNDIFAYVVKGNDKPLSLFRRLGFEIIDDAGYAYLQK